MLIKNQIYETKITDSTTEGQGIAHIEGCAVFIPNAVACETCRVRIELVRKTWAAGKIVEILENPPTGSIGSALWPNFAAAAISGTSITKRKPV